MHDITVEFNDDGTADLVGTIYDEAGLNPSHIDFHLTADDATALDVLFAALVGREFVRESIQGVVDRGFAGNWPRPDGTEDLTHEQMTTFVNGLVDGGTFDEVIAEFVASVA